MTAKEILQAAKALISERKHWIKGALAEDCFHLPVEPASVHAAMFCMYGAVRAAASGKNPVSGVMAIMTLEQACGGTAGSVYEYNDNNSHEAVLKKMDEAIEMA